MRMIFPSLAIAGVLPFVLCSVSLALNIYVVPVFGLIKQVMGVYALVIASFMAGSLWGMHFKSQTPWHILLPFASNVIAIILWLAYLLLPFDALLLVYSLLFCILLLIDYPLFKADVISKMYFSIRAYVTCVVVITLLLAYAA